MEQNDLFSALLVVLGVLKNGTNLEQKTKNWNKIFMICECSWIKITLYF